MDPKELPAEARVMFRLDNVAEAHRHEHGVALAAADIDAVALDRIELVEIHHVLARLAVDPVDRRLDRELPQVLAEIARYGMEADDREIGADRQQHDAGAMTSQRGIELERTRQQFRAQERPGTVADDDDFVRLAGPRDLDQTLGKSVDPLVPFG